MLEAALGAGDPKLIEEALRQAEDVSRVAAEAIATMRGLLTRSADGPAPPQPPPLSCPRPILPAPLSRRPVDHVAGNGSPHVWTLPISSLSPGFYLRRRREAASLSIDDVALRIDTFSQTCARYRADLIASIETDDVPISPGTAIALHRAFPFDPLVLDRLIEIRAGSAIAEPHLCRVCACSWFDPCDAAPFGRCGWAKDDNTLCTACAARPEVTPAIAEIIDLSWYRAAAKGQQSDRVA